MSSIFSRLAEPFDPSDLEWRPGATNADKTRALALTYITSRAVMDRLDEVVGPENWRDDFKPGPDGGLICGLSLRIDGEWITKWDGAENTDFEAVKGGLSDALKRAAVKWGIGRYLYKLPQTWVACEQRGKNIVLLDSPDLPEWALPHSNGGMPETNQPGNGKEPPVPPRDQQILKELGFQPRPQSEWIPEAKRSNGARSVCWNAAVVEAIRKAGLAENALGAVQLLNTSDLPKDASPEAAVAWARTNRSN
jgi:hypothetical protein